MQMTEVKEALRPLNTEAMQEAQKRLDSIAHPLGSLGVLEENLVRIAGITGSAQIDIAKKAVAVFCADNGVVVQGITQTGHEVTGIVAENMTAGDACVCIMGKVAGADVIPIDIGIAGDIDAPGLRNYKVAYGTYDFTQGGPAMMPGQTEQALTVGVNLARELKEAGYGMAAIGEMGIGNTTTSAAMSAVLLNLPVEEVTGRGAGLSSEGLDRKIYVIKKGIMLQEPDPNNAFEVLCKLGGFDIAGMAGFCIGAATCGLPVVLDGVISCVAAYTAWRLFPQVKDYLFPSHMSAEPAGKLLLEKMGLEPVLHAKMRLGEGTGAVATFPMYDMIAAVYNTMTTFQEEEIKPYEKLN